MFHVEHIKEDRKLVPRGTKKEKINENVPRGTKKTGKELDIIRHEKFNKI